MKKRIFKAMWLSVMAVAVVTVSSCSSDSDFFGLDGLEDMDYLNAVNSYNNSTFLDLDIDTIKEWSTVSLSILDEAEVRMGISYDKDLRLFAKNQLSASDLNISKKLYDAIWTNYKSLNVKFHENKNNLLRSKSRSVEGGGENNCFVLSANACSGVPIGRIIAQCNYEDPGWQSRGGIDLGHASSILYNIGFPVTTLYDSQDIRDYYGSTTTFINGIMVYPTSIFPYYHAVHATQYDGSGVINKVIYNDPQNGTSYNWMAVYAVNCMFVQ